MYVERRVRHGPRSERDRGALWARSWRCERKRAEAQPESTSLVDEAYQALKTAIRNNVFPPGHQAAEPEIARQLGMSRTPVHEAIIRLQEEGLVQVLPRRGVLICPISADDIREIYDVLIAVEGMAAALLATLPEEPPWPRPKRSIGRPRQWSRPWRREDCSTGPPPTSVSTRC